MLGPRPRSLAAGLAAAALAPLGCGEQENPALIPEGDAQALIQTVDGIGNAVDGGECATAQLRVQEARNQVAALPGTLDQDLRDRLGQGLTHIEGRIPLDCAPPQEPAPAPAPEVPEPRQTPEPEPPAPTPEPEPETPPEAPPDDDGDAAEGDDGTQP